MGSKSRAKIQAELDIEFERQRIIERNMTMKMIQDFAKITMVGVAVIAIILALTGCGDGNRTTTIEASCSNIVLKSNVECGTPEEPDEDCAVCDNEEFRYQLNGEENGLSVDSCRSWMVESGRCE